MDSKFSHKTQLRRFATFNFSITSNKIESTVELRPSPSQRAHIGESNARRLLRRAQLSKNKTDPDEPIFAVQQEGDTRVDSPVSDDQRILRLSVLQQQCGYSVQCYATHEEDAQRCKQAMEIEKEKRSLFNSINSTRATENEHPLILKPHLCQRAQDYADMLYHEDRIDKQLHLINTPLPNSTMVVISPSGKRKARLVSPPGMGALACGEMWYSGKYRRHLYGLQPERMANHPDDCPCHLRIAFETMVDDGWNGIGIGRGEDGRWVVQLAQ